MWSPSSLSSSLVRSATIPIAPDTRTSSQGQAGGLGLELNARALLAHEDENFRGWGVSGALTFDPDPSSDRGLSLSVGPSWGASATGGAEALLGPETMSGLALDNTPPPGGRLGVEAAWGFPGATPERPISVSGCGRADAISVSAGGWGQCAAKASNLRLAWKEGALRATAGRPSTGPWCA